MSLTSTLLAFTAFIKPLFVDYFFDRAADLIQDGIDFLVNIGDQMFGILEDQISSTPYPKDASGDPVLFGPPDNSFEASYLLYENVIQELAISLVLIAFIFHALFRVINEIYSLPTDYSPNDQIRVCLKAIGVTVFWWPIGVLLYLSSDLIAQVFLSYNPTESLNVEVDENYSSFGATLEVLRNSVDDVVGAGGNIVTLLIIIIPLLLKSSLIFLFLILWQIRDVFLYLLLPTYPLVYVFKAFKFPMVDFVEDIGSGLTSIYLNLIFLTIPGAALVQFYGVAVASGTEMISAVEGGSAPTTEATAVLASGAVAQSGASELVIQVLILLLLLAFAVTFPLVVAGGPFGVLLASSGGPSSITGIAKAAANPASAAGGFLENAVPGGSADQAENAKERYNSLKSSFANAGGSAEGEGAEGAEGSDGESETSTADRAAQSRTENIKSRISDFKSSVSEEGGYAEAAAAVAGGTTAGQMVTNRPSKGEAAVKGASKAGQGAKGFVGKAKGAASAAKDKGISGIQAGYLAKENPEAAVAAARQSSKNFVKNGRAKAKVKSNKADETIHNLGADVLGGIDGVQEQLYQSSQDALDRAQSATEAPEVIQKAREDAKQKDTLEVVEDLEQFSDAPPEIQQMYEQKEKYESQAMDQRSEFVDNVRDLQGTLLAKYGKEELEEKLGQDITQMNDAEIMNHVETFQLKKLLDTNDVAIPKEYLDSTDSVEEARIEFAKDSLSQEERFQKSAEIEGRKTVGDVLYSGDPQDASDRISADSMREFIENTDYNEREVQNMRQEEFASKYREVFGEELGPDNSEALLRELIDQADNDEQIFDGERARDVVLKAQKAADKKATAETLADNAVDDDLYTYFNGGDVDKQVQESLDWMNDELDTDSLSEETTELFSMVMDSDENIDEVSKKEVADRLFTSDMEDNPLTENTTMREEDLMRVKGAIQDNEDRKQRAEKIRDEFVQGVIDRTLEKEEGEPIVNQERARELKARR